MTTTSHILGTTKERLVGIDLARTSLVFQNTHATANIYIADDQDVNTLMIRIQAGATASLKIPEDDPTTEWWGISDTASTTIVIYQGYGRTKVTIG